MPTQTISNVVYVPSAANNTPGATLASGDTLNLLASGGIVDFGTGSGSVGISGGGANSLVLNSSVFSLNAAGISLAAGGNDVNVGAGSTVAADNLGTGIAIQGNSSVLGIAGAVTGGFKNYANWIESASDL
jgi:hypothetical protein